MHLVNDRVTLWSTEGELIHLGLDIRHSIRPAQCILDECVVIGSPEAVDGQPSDDVVHLGRLGLL